MWSINSACAIVDQIPGETKRIIFNVQANVFPIDGYFYNDLKYEIGKNEGLDVTVKVTIIIRIWIFEGIIRRISDGGIWNAHSSYQMAGEEFMATRIS
jgi:hypothetical protein